jgi:23S rRNA (cytidine2498-2'-O)-methyltransferase
VKTACTSLILYCRSGFESECASEVQECAAERGAPGYCRAQPGAAFVEFVPFEPASAFRLLQTISLSEFIFARQVFAARRIGSLPVTDRVAPLLAALGGQRVSDLFVETADTNESKELLVFCRKFEKPFSIALKAAGLLTTDPDLPRLHLFFLDSENVFIGLGLPHASSPWFMGIPRLRFPTGAPSRSALKLEEAFHIFLGDERQKHLRAGMRAADLGAAPGGWTWLLVMNGIHVIAVDNGPMDAQVMASGLVEHRREDGFRFRPNRPLDWLVCDMVEQPIRIARLIADWATSGLFRESIFNLKLPMKKRHQEVMRCKGVLEERLEGRSFQLSFKQLYHDREEVTGYLRLKG